ncbi:exosporium glycoprotein BclB-related protein [Sporosarcina beigongshangi]|uniref:exosporium glycoprotein BclB-related protein n=1 Tax=Sporosarcina beigongshangi TaxID=2782538 RepID=UPI00193A5A35|nr:exosporium glycoprotein BclB-related protein [Sporosarcina beigongshangi]
MSFNHGCCGRQAPSNGSVNCTALGPFRAIDAACIVPPALTGSIIPFASGATAVALTSLAGGLVGTPSLIGFGTAVPGVFLAGNAIDLTGLINEAFSVPRPGLLTAISASFTLTAALTLAESATVSAEIYRAPAGSNTFTPTGVRVDLAPTLTPLITVGTTLSGASSNFAPVPVAVGDRLLMVFTLGGSVLAGAVTGTASAGVTIA